MCHYLCISAKASFYSVMMSAGKCLYEDSELLLCLIGEYLSVIYCH